MKESIKNKFNLEGKVAIITGASKGIGKSIAKGFVEFGAKVAISSRNQNSLEEVAKELGQENILPIQCHVGKDEDIINLVNSVAKTFGRIDILVNNAATNPFYGELEDTNNELFDKVINVNLKAPHQLANKCLPFMKKNSCGSIINIASVEGLKPSENLGIYSISKSALIMLTKSQAKEWGKFGIRSNAICPGLIKTKFSSALWTNENVLSKVKNDLPLRKIAEPDDMAGLACFLASAASYYSTGSEQNIINKAYSTEVNELSDLKNYVGKEIGLSEWTTITQDQINTFAKITDDNQWIHISPELCEKHSPYKKPVAHGFLVLSLAPKFCYETLKLNNVSMAVNYGCDKVRFMNATRVNSSIRARISVISFEDIKGGIKYKLKIIYELKDQEKPACVAEFISIAYK